MRDRILRAIRARVLEPILRLLQQGVTHHAMAVSMSVGTVIGVFPVLGSTTVICLLVAVVLRLNLVAIQALNWLVYPVQIILIVPFIELGETMLASDARQELSVAQLQAAFDQGWLQVAGDMWRLILSGMLAWSIAAVPAGLLLYQLFRWLLRRFDRGDHHLRGLH